MWVVLVVLVGIAVASAVSCLIAIVLQKWRLK
jgi:hypothetical protein